MLPWGGKKFLIILDAYKTLGGRVTSGVVNPDSRHTERIETGSLATAPESTAAHLYLRLKIQNNIFRLIILDTYETLRGRVANRVRQVQQ